MIRTPVSYTLRETKAKEITYCLRIDKVFAYHFKNKILPVLIDLVWLPIDEGHPEVRAFGINWILPRWADAFPKKADRLDLFPFA